MQVILTLSKMPLEEKKRWIIIQSKEIENKVYYEEKRQLEKWQSEILPEYWHHKGERRLMANCN